MPKEELNLEDINLFDPNNVDHAMALFKDIIRQYKDDINKYKNADLTQVDIDTVFSLAKACHEIASTAYSVVFTTKDFGEANLLDILYEDYYPEEFKQCYETSKNVDNLKAITDVISAVDFDENGYVLDQCRKAFDSIQERLEKDMEHDELFNNKMMRIFDSALELIENIQEFYKFEQDNMMSELSEKYPECRGAQLFDEAGSDFDDVLGDDEDDDFDEDWDGDEDFNIADDIITLDSEKDFAKHGIKEDDLVAANYIKNHLKKFKK